MNRAIRYLALGVLLSSGWTCDAAGSGSAEPVPETADLVLLGGKVLTVDPRDSIAEAIAVKDGRILAVGGSQPVSRFIGAHTKIIRLRGQTVMPGIVDAHTHLEGIAAFHRMLDIHVPPLKGVDEILRKVSERASAVPAGEWIVGAGGWGQVLPTREQLDRAAPNHPVVLRESAHVQVLNTRALTILGIDRDYAPPRGGHVFKDPVSG
jgi:predicted amidohydrolase YtcJ